MVDSNIGQFIIRVLTLGLLRIFYFRGETLESGTSQNMLMTARKSAVAEARAVAEDSAVVKHFC